MKKYRINIEVGDFGYTRFYIQTEKWYGWRNLSSTCYFWEIEDAREFIEILKQEDEKIY